MAYNRWLSSQYSYSPGYDLMHYGRKGMKWGKHIFGLPEINLNGGGGSSVDLEELKKLLAQGKITYDEFKTRLAKEWQSTVDANKKGFNQVQDKFSEFYKSLADTYDNFKAGDSADKKPDKRKFSPWDPNDVKDKFDRTDDYDDRRTNNYWVRSDRGNTTILTDRELDKDYRAKKAEKKKKAAEERRSSEDTARVNSKLQARKGQNARDAAENERNRLKDLASKPTTPRKAAPSSSQRQTTRTPNQNRSDDSSALADLIRTALSSTSSSTTTSNQAQAQKKPASSQTTTNKQAQAQKEQASESYDFGAKQKKIYSTIAKYLGMLIHASSPSNAMRKSLKYAVKPR